MISLFKRVSHARKGHCYDEHAGAEKAQGGAGGDCGADNADSGCRGLKAFGEAGKAAFHARHKDHLQRSLAAGYKGSPANLSQAHFDRSAGISTNQIDEMERSFVTLVVPRGLHGQYPPKRRDKLLTVARFIDSVRSQLAG